MTTRLRTSVEETGGVVSSRLRPWIDVDLIVEAVETDAEEVRFLIRVVLANSGAVPGRDIAVQALSLNASATQANDLATFFDRPPSEETSIAALAPMASEELRHVLRMPRAAVQEFEAGGRRLFVPILAFVTSYRWSSGQGCSASAFLLGHEQPSSDRLAPLSLPAGPSRLGSVGTRRLPESVRA